MKWKQRELEFRHYSKDYGPEAGWLPSPVKSINGWWQIDGYNDEAEGDTINVQYAGQKDVKKVKIFEADIVRHYRDWFKPVGIIKFRYFRFLLSCPKNNLEMYIMHNEKLEILGNVFQNPELVKKYKLELK